MQKPTVCLSWPGKGAPPAPTTASLTVARAGDPRANLVLGDNLDALRALAPRLAGAVTLAYLDPPFLTGRIHERVTRVRDVETGKVRRTKSAAFDDRWDGLDHYLEALAPRMVAVRELLAPHGSVVLHVDSKTSHYAKVLCDEIFGQRAFASEIVWRYRRWPSKTPNFQRLHDVLLRYVKDPDVRPRFRQLYEPLAPSTLATWGKKKQRAVVDGEGRRTRSSKTEEATPGAPLGDVWDIGIVAPVARERTGYPTQKPELLLARLVESLSDPGEVVLDPYVGSGTTAAVCARLGRHVVGIDSNPEAIEITRRRLQAGAVEPTEERVTLRPGVHRASRRGPSRAA
ncbi:MAG TPA: site-specific DNA-methyltransferase [Polyangiaceae bacterium]|jgi:site-specific DNA-methyltransferase (adenine-specific)|nr:site-specific DNA-methyltransferase [Polyangiaceae bacterium]